jgi:hypothetical protein
MFSRWIVTNFTSVSVTTFLAFLAGIISWSVYCTLQRKASMRTVLQWVLEEDGVKARKTGLICLGIESNDGMCKIALLDFVHGLNYKITAFRKLDSASVFR